MILGSGQRTYLQMVPTLAEQSAYTGVKIIEHTFRLAKLKLSNLPLLGFRSQNISSDGTTLAEQSAYTGVKVIVIPRL